MPHFAETVLEAAGVGGWAFELATGRMTLTAITFGICELDPPDAPPLSGVLALYPPEARAVVAALVQAAIEDGTPWQVETPLITARGRHLWVRSSGIAVREDAHTVRLVGALEDLTERRAANGLVSAQADFWARRAAEDKARIAATERERAELLLLDVLDALPSAITAYDSHDRLILSNRSYREMFPISARFAVPGRSHAEVVGLAAEHGQFADAPTDPVARDAWVAGHRRHFHEGRTHELRLPHGRVAEVQESRSQTGNRITVRTDVTDLRRAEELARAAAAERTRAEALLRDVVNAVPNAIAAYDPEERLILTNPAIGERTSLRSAFSNLGGGRLEDAVRLGVGDGYFLDAPAATAEHEAWIAQFLAYLRDPVGASRAVRLSDGRTVQVSARRSESGNLVIVHSDITELVRAQELLQEVMDAVPSAIVAYDRDERLILTNPADAERASLPPAALGERLEDVLRLAVAHSYFVDAPAAPAEHEAFVAQLLAYLRDPSGVPRAMRLGDGRTVQVSARRSASGNLVIVRTDITELLRAQVLLRDVMDALPCAVVALDRDERLIMFNRAHVDMTPPGTPFATRTGRLEELVRAAAAAGHFPDAPTAPAERDIWIDRYLAFMRDSGGAPRTTRLRNGRFLQVMTRRSESGNLVIVRTDITEQMNVQALLQDVMDALPNAVVAFDRDERLILSNRANEVMSAGRPAFSVLGARLPDLLRIAGETAYFADAPTAPAERAGWLDGLLDYLRDPGGEPRTMRLATDRYVQVAARRSETGNLVIVRTDTTELLTAQAMLRDVLDAAPNSIAAYDADDRLILVNPAYQAMFPASVEIAAPGRSYEDIVRHSVDLGTYPAAGETPEAREAWIAAQVAHHRTPGEVRILRMADGRVILARERRSDSGSLVSVRTDITDQSRTEALLRDVVETLPSAVLVYDRAERLVLWNGAAVDLLPLSGRFAAVGRTLEEMLRFSAGSGEYAESSTTPEQREEAIATRLAAYRAGTGSRTLRLRDGRFLTALERRSDSGNLVCVRTDTTDLKRAEEHLRWQAERDPLTLLHNRTFFMTALHRALTATAKDKAAGGALLLLDIDHFKQINDTLGHDMGDALLLEIAARLRLHLRDDGEGSARLGGDEFGVVIPGLGELGLAGGPGTAIARVDGLHAALSASVDLGGRRTSIGISMGVTCFPADGADATKLLKNADLALYEAKRTGRGRWSAFREEQATALERNLRMTDALREALTRGEVTVALQPKRRLRDGAHAGFEALARWHDGTGWVPPGEFVPAAEETGLIRLLGRAILVAALARVRDIRDSGFDPGRVAVNVTEQQLLDPHFKDETMAALQRYELRPEDLEFEVSGTALVGRASARIDGGLRELSAAGITLTLDDFGTSTTSLAHLARLPIDRLKIDRSFADDIGPGESGGVIVRAVIGLAHSLGMEPIAKGVETEEQLEFLAAAGCDVAQGYLISRPLLTTAQAVAYLCALTPPAKIDGIGVAV